eukprot:12488459-Alexandrium_andersonii.AAC.1
MWVSIRPKEFRSDSNVTVSQQVPVLHQSVQRPPEGAARVVGCARGDHHRLGKLQDGVAGELSRQVP